MDVDRQAVSYNGLVCIESTTFLQRMDEDTACLQSPRGARAPVVKRERQRGADAQREKFAFQRSLLLRTQFVEGATLDNFFQLIIAQRELDRGAFRSHVPRRRSEKPTTWVTAMAPAVVAFWSERSSTGRTPLLKRIQTSPRRRRSGVNKSPLLVTSLFWGAVASL